MDEAGVNLDNKDGNLTQAERAAPNRAAVPQAEPPEQAKVGQSKGAGKKSNSITLAPRNLVGFCQKNADHNNMAQDSNAGAQGE